MSREPEAIRVESERVSGDRGDFLRVLHRKIQHRRPDNTWSAVYSFDSVLRRAGMDAVAFVLYRRGTPGEGEAVRGRGAGSVRGVGEEGGTLLVGLRSCRRPAVLLDRGGLPDPPLDAQVWEVPAGIIEQGEWDEPARQNRCRLEALEEMGARVAPERFQPLGPPVWLSLGVMAERIYLYAAPLSEEPLVAPTGDGSPMEQDARIRWVSVADALALCRRGRSDAKSEIALLRFREWIDPGLAHE